MAMFLMRLNFVEPDPGGAATADRYRAGIEMARLVDRRGFQVVSLEEHHANAIGWSPTPLLNAGMILSSTENLLVTISALLLPLHDPIRVAEDLAVLDLVSRGRISIVAGLGYRPVEYAAHRKDWTRRGRLLDEALEIMLKAWTGEPFTFEGETIQVTPRPYTQPHPMVMVGGSSPAAARRAARFGLPFQLPGQVPEIEELYRSECERRGVTPMCIAPHDVAMVNVVDDPDRAWATLGEHLLLEARTYHEWQPPGQTSAVHSHASTVEELRAEGIYQFLTPDEAVDRARRTGVLTLHPLVGGMPLDEAWSSVEMCVDRVVPALAD